MLNLSTKIENLTPIGKKVAPKLKKLGINNVKELLFYYPYRYEDWSLVKNIVDLEPNTQVTIHARLELIDSKRSPWRKKLITEAIVADATGSIKIIWFNQPYLTRNLQPGDELFVSGKVELKPDGLQFVHPNHEKINRYKQDTTHTARIIPIYSLTKNITAKQLRYLMKEGLRANHELLDWLPQDIIQANKLLPLQQAIAQIHFPDNQIALNEALARIKFNELFLIQLRAAVSKQALDNLDSYVIEFKAEETKNLVSNLPFKLTNAQKVTAWEIIKDLGQPRPMNRLLEGDVGSGKTIVSALAVFNCFLNKLQCAYMAPTEILALQQFENLSKLFTNYKIKIALLTGANSIIKENGQNIILKKIDLQKKISKGEINLVIGTHALIQNKISFKKLGLIILDEQHRFGIKQRQALKQKNSEKEIPHLLSMTATPIPRSLALTVYGDLDLSVINEMPPSRQTIITEVVPAEKRSDKYQFIKERLKAGEQVFVICPLIDPSDTLGVKAVKDEYRKLNEKIFPDVSIGLMHGKLKSKDKDIVMQNFLDKKTSILVSTPVIEVGIDIKNATVMLIESAERFGLAQLHQFRGRVGRGDKQSYCFLFSDSDSDESMRRLQTMVTCQNGFDLAEVDLEFRGPGEVYGIHQSGHIDELKVAKLTDYIIIKRTRSAVEALLKTDSSLTHFPLVRERLQELETNTHFE